MTSIQSQKTVIVDCPRMAAALLIPTIEGDQTLLLGPRVKELCSEEAVRAATGGSLGLLFAPHNV